MKSVKIKLSNKFNRSISTRIAVENLFKDIYAEEIIIDFSDIYFISSSAAHQMVIEVKRLEKQNVKVNIENMTDDVFKMLELAKTDRKNIFTIKPFLKHYVISSGNDLSGLSFDVL
jgi:anti-anti-sigma regulatory factor